MKKCLPNYFGNHFAVEGITKQSLYKPKSLASSLANMDTPVAATSQIKISGGVLFVRISIGVPKTVLLVNRAFVPPEKRGFLTKMAKMTNLHSNQ